MTRPGITIRLHPDDDVVIATRPLASGTVVPGERVTVGSPIPFGHKVATRAIARGAPVHRYDQIIGVATQDIAPGEHVHTHNLAMAEFERDYAFSVAARETAREATPATYMGIRRPDGRVATRNYIGILSSVNCSATVVRAIADRFRRDIHPEALADAPNVDGVVALPHALGCGIDARGEGMAILRRTLAGYATHANFHGVLLVGLGCEVNQIGDLVQLHRLREGERLRTFTIQDTGGSSRTIQRGVEAVRAMLSAANDVHREPVPVSHLVVGLQCGGSDSYSGITANPALGAAVDTLVRHGGTAILSETPEIYGAEHLLTRRAVSPEVGRKLVRRIAWWKDHCARNPAALDHNRSAGNTAGGLTTVLEKSLGGVAKAGTTNLVDVYEYAEPVTARGLVFMDSPGYDPISTTGQVASGANMICFTTGRGSAFGCAAAPSIKLATNTELWRRQEEDLDLDCGTIAEGLETIEEVGARIFRAMIDCASGARSKSERHGYGQDEFMPWPVGAIT